MTEPEVLVNVSMRFPALDTESLADHLAGLIRAAIAAGGLSTTVSLQGYDPDGDE